MSFIHKLCDKLGENNKPIYTVAAIACGKGTVRPILSITDKKEAPDARKYAALRELMTEFIGVPTTLGLGLLGETIAKAITHKGSAKYRNANAVLSFLGICLAAGYFVPKFCNIGMPPVMKKLMPNYDPNAAVPSAPAVSGKAVVAKNSINTKTPQVSGKIQSVPMSGRSLYYQSGMKV